VLKEKSKVTRNKLNSGPCNLRRVAPKLTGADPPNSKMHITKLFIVLILLCCSACSTVSLGYDHADWILRYWMNLNPAVTLRR
jgi:hypothetical protein